MEKLIYYLQLQYNQELEASWIYNLISNRFSNLSLDGFAEKFRRMSKEEYGHAIGVMNYCNKIDINLNEHDTVVMPPVKAYKEPSDAIKAYVTKNVELETSLYETVNNCYQVAQSINHGGTIPFASSFLERQIEEIDEAQSLLDRCLMVFGDNAGLLDIDRQLLNDSNCSPF